MAIAKATGGRVTDAPDDSGAAVRSPRLAAQLDASGPRKDRTSVTADVLIGIEYWDSDFEGSTYTFTAPWGCTTELNNVDWQVASLPSNWNDEIGSYRAFSNCWAKHYEHMNFEGRSVGWGGGGNLPFSPKSIQWS